MTRASTPAGRAHLGRAVAHHVWDRAIPPALVVAPGSDVELHLRDGSDGQLTRASTAQSMLDLDPQRMDPLTGPVWVQGAHPGDALRVEVLEITLAAWGWSGIIPGLGLLQDKFPGPLLRFWELGAGAAHLGAGMMLALEPMVGVIGVAPAAPGPHRSTVPTEAGGNMDVKYVTAGSVVHLPVQVEGALLSLGDAHARQGDGELSGTAIECEADVVVRIDLVQGAGIDAPVVDSAPEPTVQEPLRSFLGVGPDLFEACRDAALRATTALGEALGVGDAEAYALLGTVGELRVHEIVDKPNWVAGCMLPRRLFG